MFCCANCIGDKILGERVIAYHSIQRGICDFCASTHVDLVSPSKLRDNFEFLITTLYRQEATGERLSVCLKRDWGLFNHASMNDANIQRLLAEIMDDGEMVRRPFISVVDGQEEALEKWKQFKDELKTKNRFFLKSRTEADNNLLNELLVHLKVKSRDLTLNWFRARINNGAPISLDKMGAPPQQLATHGRANPAGIPYLYVASDLQTAISETRPHTGEKVSVAEFAIYEDLDFIDLRSPKGTISPFVDEEDTLLNLSKNLIFLSELGDDLTRPVLPHAAITDYIPTQYLCEFIKHSGYHGVVYKSSIGGGMNLALFDQVHANPISVVEHYVSNVSVSSSPVT